MGERKIFWASAITAIVLFLALLSVPITKSIRERIKEKRFKEGVKVAVNHMRIIWRALQQYRRDWGGKLPVTLDALYPKYIHDKSVFLHPLDNGKYPKIGHSPRIRTSFDYEAYFWLVPWNQKYLPAEEFYREILPRKDFRILCSRIIKWVGREPYELVCFSDGRIGWAKALWDYSYGRILRMPGTKEEIERLKRRGNVRLPKTLISPPPEVFKSKKGGTKR